MAAGGFQILALSWEPAFCEAHSGVPECTTQAAGRADATALSLHGLWPRNNYCGVSKDAVALDRQSDWAHLPPVNLDPATAKYLAAAMPGTRSFLERHEWLKHGTCFGGNQQTFFTTALKLFAAVNASPVGKTLAASVGKTITQAEIRQAFDAAFGAGAGDRVRIACTQDGSRRLITEITVGLYGDISPNPDLASLILAARPTDGGCNAGVLDPVGLQ
jgi:ribonuclease T2